MFSLRSSLITCVVATLSAACSFDSSGVTYSDAGANSPDAPFPADARVNDAPPGTPDAMAPIDAAPPIDSALPDFDEDGVPDISDNCVQTPNADQANEDSDVFGDACDNCPHITNPTQADTGETLNGGTADGIGDDCDPRPDGDGDVMLVFDGFNGSTLNPMWQNGPGTGSDTWELTGTGFLRQPMTDVVSRSLMYMGTNESQAIVTTRFQAVVVAPATDPGDVSRSVGPIGAWADGTDLGSGYACLHHLNPSDLAAGTELSLARYDDSGGVQLDFTPLGWTLQPATVYASALYWNGIDDEQGCSGVSTGFATETTAGDDDTYASGTFGVRTYGVSAQFAYVVIYQLGF